MRGQGASMSALFHGASRHLYFALVLDIEGSQASNETTGRRKWVAQEASVGGRSVNLGGTGCSEAVKVVHKLDALSC